MFFALSTSYAGRAGRRFFIDINMEKFWARSLRSFRYGYLRIVRIKAPAEAIALGLAIGVFVGCLPLLSLQMVIAVALAFVLRASKIAAALGTWWSNPLNWALIFPLFYMLGKLFVPVEIPALSMAELRHLEVFELLRRGWQWLLVTTLGASIAGIPLSVGTYYATLRMVRLYHDRRAARKRDRQRRDWGRE